MKAITINLYELQELNEQAKQKALDEYRYINVEHEWWDYIFEDFKAICATIGIQADTGKMYFRGFYSQGDGSAFDATINVPSLLDGIRQEKWKEYAPNEKLSFAAMTIDNRILNLFKSQLIDSPIIISKAHYIVVEQPFDFEYNKRTDFTHIEDKLQVIRDWVEGVAKQLNRFLYNTLRDNYEELISDKAVTDGIEANEYQFTSDGKPANRLALLAGE